MELLVVQGPDTGRTFPLAPQSVIGRDPTAAVSLNDEEVSRRHAIVSVGEGEISIEDLGSSNGTFVDDTQVDGETPLQLGARIRVGKTLMELRARQAAGDPENLAATKVPLPEFKEPA
jgi:DNA segregation ATPase FtsK/SpoIIIE, S-DNA-T family